MNNVVLITGASSGFGALIARVWPVQATRSTLVCAKQLAECAQVKDVEEYAAAQGVDLHAIELDVLLQESADRAIDYHF